MISAGRWEVGFDPEFATEIDGFPTTAQKSIAVLVGLLQALGPQLRRPYCDTLKGSAYANMKELRVTVPDGEWRIAFAFDPERRAILLVGGSKSGVNERRFYDNLIRVADKRFDAHLARFGR